ncbi:MAG: alpha-amylase family protein [bacterium]
MPSLHAQEWSRREFIRTALLSGFPLAGGRLSQASANESGASGPDDSWFGHPMRWAQLTLVENDPGRYDPQFWLDYFDRIHCDAVCLSAGGIVAYYPTQIPLHHRSAWMKDTDPFGELLAGCRRRNRIVIARTDPHAARQDVHDAHPDWIAVDPEGHKKRHWANPDLWVTCALGPYNFEFMTAVHKEIVSLYSVDGIFSNRWAGHGLCYCEHCRRSFREATGMELPSGNPQDPARKPYTIWMRQRLRDLWRLWDREIRQINPRARFIPNGFPDFKTIGEMADIFVIDHQARRGFVPPWSNGKTGKEYRAVMGNKPVVGLFSVGLEEPYRWKDSVQSEAEIRIWVAEATANGLRPWFTKFSGTLYDRRWLKVVEGLYNRYYRAERYLRNEHSLARVALAYADDTRSSEATQGMYHALLEARVPFEMVHADLLEPERIKPYKLLILPNLVSLSDAACRQIRDFVHRGGSLIATYETSLADEEGKRRSDFGLADVFGVSFKKRMDGPIRNSYWKLESEPDAGPYHPILAGLEDAGRIINGVWQLEVEPLTEFPSPLTLIPTYPDLPMEDVYPRIVQTDIRGIYLRGRGQGRVVYFPWDIDRVFWEVMNVDHGQLLRNAVEWALNEDKPVTVTGPGFLDVMIWRQKASLTVHLVNLTNPMMMKGPFRELLPLGPLEVKIQLPPGKAARKVQLLMRDSIPEANEYQGIISLTVPEILDHEIIAVDL